MSVVAVCVCGGAHLIGRYQEGVSRDFVTLKTRFTQHMMARYHRLMEIPLVERRIANPSSRDWVLTIALIRLGYRLGGEEGRAMITRAVGWSTLANTRLRKKTPGRITGGGRQSPDRYLLLPMI